MTGWEHLNIFITLMSFLLLALINSNTQIYWKSKGIYLTGHKEVRKGIR
jgi:uncharacterized protein YpmB